jgi:hypothetical protein
MATSHSRIPPLQRTLFIPLTPLKINRQIRLVLLLPKLLNSFGLASPDTGLKCRENGCGKGRVYFLVGGIIRDVAQVAVGGLKRRYLKDVWRLNQGLSKSLQSRRVNRIAM